MVHFCLGRSRFGSSSSSNIAGSLLILLVTLGATNFLKADDGGQPWSQQAEDDRIRQYRTADITLTVLDGNGHPLANQAVTVGMTRQQFLFGSNLLSLFGVEGQDKEAAYEQRLSALMNYATLPFYWDYYEQKEGTTDAPRLRKMAEWCREHGITPKGHPLCWGISLPHWLYDKSTEDVQKIQTNRIHREVSEFAGLVDAWEPVNEVMSMSSTTADNPLGRLCRQMGPEPLVRDSFNTARAANPKAKLILNDYDTSQARVDLIAAALKEGVPIDAIGIQLHMHKGMRSPQDIWDSCERMAKLGLPLQITEITILSGALKTDDDWFGPHPGWDTTPDGEKRQAQQAVDLYRLLYSCPAVQAITWWDPTDYHAWQGAPAGLLRKDMSPKPSYDALYKLIREEWWTGPQNLTTDAEGKVKFHGYLGTYELKAAGATSTFAVDKPGTDEVSSRE